MAEENQANPKWTTNPFKLDEPEQKAEGDASTPAKPSERVEGSDRNKPDSASGSRGGITISDEQEKILKDKAEKHNEKHGDKEGKKVDLGMLKAVYRRGAGAFSTSHRPGMSRQQWSIARVNSFLHLVRTGKPENSGYTQDNDLLPSGHPKKTSKATGVSSTKAVSDVDLKPTASMANFAERGLKLREEHNRGGTEVGVARARDIKNRSNLSPETVKRMNSFFSRHRVDLTAPAAKPGHKDYPSAGVIAWMLWGGNPANPDSGGAGWAERKTEELKKQTEGKKSLIDILDAVGQGRITMTSAVSLCKTYGIDSPDAREAIASQRGMALRRLNAK